MSRRILTVVTAATLGMASLAYAQTSTTPTTPSAGQPGAAQQQSPARSFSLGGKVASESEIQQKLQQQGYSNVSNITRHGSNWHAKAMKDGKNVTLNIDPETGRVTTD